MFVYQNYKWQTITESVSAQFISWKLLTETFMLNLSSAKVHDRQKSTLKHFRFFYSFSNCFTASEKLLYVWICMNTRDKCDDSNINDKYDGIRSIGELHTKIVADIREEKKCTHWLIWKNHVEPLFFGYAKRGRESEKKNNNFTTRFVRWFFPFD